MTSFLFGSVPSTGLISSGDGKRFTTASSSIWIPLFLNADPQSTGTNLNPSVPFRSAS